MYVRLREAHGGLRSNRVTVNSSDTVLATPPIGVQVVVFTGKHKGLKGIVEVMISSVYESSLLIDMIFLLEY